MIFLHGLDPLQILGALRVEETGPAPDHEDLPDFLFNAQRAQRFHGPFVSLCGADGSRRMLLSQHGHGNGQDENDGRQDSRHGETIAEEKVRVSGVSNAHVGTAAIGCPRAEGPMLCRSETTISGRVWLDARPKATVPTLSVR